MIRSNPGTMGFVLMLINKERAAEFYSKRLGGALLIGLEIFNARTLSDTQKIVWEGISRSFLTGLSRLRTVVCN
jgi:hypothetical protein